MMRRNFFIWLAAGCLAAAIPCVCAQPSPAGREQISTPPNSAAIDAMPLLMAHQNLLLARSKVLELKYNEAVPELLAAARALGAFAQHEPGPNGQSAEFTRQRMQAYAGVIETDPGDAVRRLDNWMDRIRQWNR